MRVWRGVDGRGSAVRPRRVLKGLTADILLIALATGISRVLGLVRDASIARQFGATAAYDAFLIAFYVPQLLRQLLGEGALSTAFVPLYAGLQEAGDDADRFASNVLSLLVVLFPIVCVAGILLAPVYVPFLASGFVADKLTLTVSLSRWLFPSIALVGFGAVFMGILNAHHRFFAASFSPVWFNAGVILGALVAAPYWPGPPIFGLAAGALLGAAAQTASQLPLLRRVHFRFSFTLWPVHPDVLVLAKRMLPAVVVLAMADINLLVDNKFASYLPDGNIAALQYAMRLFQLPLGMFAVSIGTALLPRLAVADARGDPSLFRRYLGDGLATTALILIPATVGLILVGKDTVGLLFQRGSFSAADTARTYSVLVSYTFGLLAYGWDYVGVRACYALGRTGLPIVGAVASMAVNAVLDAALVGPLGAPGLALASAVAGAVDAAILLVFLRRRVSWGPLRPRLLLIAGGTLLMGGAVFGIQSVARAAPLAVRVFAPILAGILVYALCVRLTELWELVHRRSTDAQLS
ncbi:MAG: murein biosynthesis integral membrane protein MurJ [Candidatus Bipolaricaulota bacterium]|nr:murein biosynthesis integral membrane protein MurJ [Candidatus Bipolaricaulota bacterium]